MGDYVLLDAGGTAAIAGHRVSIVALFVAVLDLAVSAMRSQHAAGGALAIRHPRVLAAVALLVLRLSHRVTAAGSEQATWPTLTIAAVVDSVVAFLRALDDLIPADPFHLAVRA